MTCELQSLLDAEGLALLPAAVDAPAEQIALGDLLSSVPADTMRAWTLRCAFEEGGPWAGVRDLFRSLLADIRAADPELIERHDYELVHVLPELKGQVALRNPCLTDTAADDERIRNYPADRASRIVHGLIDLLAEYKDRRRAGAWLLVCIDYDLCGDMAARFFSELMRRQGRASRLILLPLLSGQADGRHPSFDLLSQELPFAVKVPPRADLTSAADAARRAEQLEGQVSTDILERTAVIPDLIYHWRLAGREDKLLRWTYAALVSYNTLGFYPDSARYGEQARALFKRFPFTTDVRELRWGMFFKLFMTYLGLGDAERALRLAQEDVIEDAGDVKEYPMRVSLCYMMAMLHARYMPQRDLAIGEDYLRRGLSYLEKAGLPDDQHWFQFVFNRNGLAMIRSFQGRHEEALRLCEEGYRLLEEHLASGRHRLHRSVLLYNMAQVFSQTRDYERSIAYYSAAMQMDPNYSEYYNERGNLLLKLGRLPEAESDYRRAIELSPPYHEVWTNLGQCHRLAERFAEACADYTRALELKPGQAAALVGRAQSLEALGRSTAAVADYTAALAIDPELWQARAGRAVLLYEAGQIDECLLDLDRAIALAPEEADLCQNRAVALADLGRIEEARRDLARYLELRPAAADRLEVHARLASLERELPLVTATAMATGSGEAGERRVP